MIGAPADCKCMHCIVSNNATLDGSLPVILCPTAKKEPAPRTVESEGVSTGGTATIYEGLIFPAFTPVVKNISLLAII